MADADITVAYGRMSAPAADGAPRVAGYAIRRQIGRGGMGIVWHAVELRLDREVALKVAAQDTSDLLSVWNEAKLAARVADPGVVTVLDVGRTLDGRPYYTMEYVDGTDLEVLLRDGARQPAEALRIAADIARAVGAAHERGIIHRDLKPRNVMIDRQGRARVLDFGIAVRVATQNSGQVAGSPPYMAPEQIAGTKLGPEADVYALGVMLYEMLTGRRPFEADDADTLFDLVTTTPPPSPSSIASVHPDVEALVLRCLSKSPADRFPTARALLDALEGISAGRRSAVMTAHTEADATRRIESHPDKPRRNEAQQVFRWTWQLKSSPASLWPYVADTDRFNAACGLAVVDVPQAREGVDTVARHGTARSFGLGMDWREYPFEWIRGREHTVFRWYRQGPLEALWNRVTMTGRPDGGTDLVHEVALTARGVLGRVASALEIGQRLRRAIDRMYLRIDEVVSASAGDPYDELHEPSSTTIARVDEGARRLVASGYSARAVATLGRLLLSAPQRKLQRMRPFALASDLGITPDTALSLFLHASHVGLLELSWDVVCPTCQVAHETANQLAEVKGHGRCEACETEYTRDLCSSVELVFRAHPDVRTTEVEMYCAGSPARRPHILVQVVLEPGEHRTLTCELDRGEYEIGAFGIAHTAPLAVSPIGHLDTCTVTIDDAALSVHPGLLRQGPITMDVYNNTVVERTVRLEVRSAREDAVPAVVALTTPRFRDYFGNELLAPDELLDVGHLYFLAVDASDRGGLFASRGDAAACASLREFEQRFVATTRESSGAPITGMLDTFVAAFPSGEQAVKAALALQSSTALPLRCAIHGGRCLALTRQQRIDYFGETLHRTVSLVATAAPGEIVLSHAAAGDRDVALTLDAASAHLRVDIADTGPYAGRRVVRAQVGPTVIEPPSV